MSILIKNVELAGKNTHIFIEDKFITELGKVVEADRVLDGTGKIAFPAFYNTHTHAAMTLLRGYADDMKLMPWLKEKIWPLEAQLTADDVYWGTKLAILEMIKTGTVFFNDMYFFMEGVADAVGEMGVRAALSYGFIDLFDKEKLESEIRKTEEFIRYVKQMGDPRIQASVGPHAVYTVSKEGLEWARDFAKEHGIYTHIHVSETEFENSEFRKKTGMSPFAFLDSMGFLNERCMAAHAVWANTDDIEALTRTGTVVAFNPTSNMKLSVGSMLPYKEMREHGVHLTLATDGCSSNNSLDMVESMKFGALGLKSFYNDPELAPAGEIFKMATENGARAFGIDGGVIQEGKVADLILVDARTSFFTPNYNPISNLVYAAPGTVVDTTICDGTILMENKKVEGEETIINKTKSVGRDLISRLGQGT